MQPRTVGIEEELFLVDPETRLSAPRSAQVLEQAEHSDAGSGEVEHELFRHQVETKTPPLRSLRDLREHLVRGRRLAAQAAEGAGLLLLASGTVPTGGPDTHLTADDRYRDMMDRYGEVARPMGTCGMHVHLGVESAEAGVAVIDGLAPWLPVVLALSANSPYHHGRDTSYASWRSRVWGQWPSAGPTERFGSLEGYRAVCEQMQHSGAARDEGMLYFDARLSADHPTVEVRISDVCTDPDDAVLVAAVLRGLVEREPGRDPAAAGRGTDGDAYVWRSELLRAAQWRAARYGVSDSLLDPTTGRLEKAEAVLDRLLSVTASRLEEAGDLRLVEEGLARVLSGSGASRQRAAYERSGDLGAVVDDLVDRTNRSWREDV